ncbi:hypothetical protein [Tenacibaculum amylolyticum]|uniref:hypothetical protein n=1 Tax=Tenacibaculum amylolyticum TaxID=104269 RepID=UPI0038962D01
MITQELAQETKFISGVYNTREARELMNAIIDKQINFYKIQCLKEYEGDNLADSKYWNEKIEALIAKRESFKEMINAAKGEDCGISIDGVFEMKLIK